MKVGKYDIPTYRLHPKLFQATKVLYENFKSEEASNMLTVAKLLGHKTEKSGTFLTKLADLRSYGLITKRGVKVTDLGKKLTYDPSDDERNKALKEALLSIPLWKELYSRFGKNLPTSNFWVELTKITSLEAPDAQKVEETVRNAYLSDFKYVKEEKEPEKGVSGMGAEGKFDTSTAIIDIKAGAYNQSVPYTAEGIELAKGFLDLLGKQLKTKEETSKEETPEEEG